ncbi:MAG: TIGR00730 family Rossman fold protein [Anaerolineales bacterium]
MIQTICVYCGSADDLAPAYLEGARRFGAALAERGWTLVYGAGRTGLMGALADGALAHGAEVIGIIPRMFYTPTLAHDNLTRLEVTPDMHTRKARMAELADAFVALPGGFGTFEEFFEILTWAQIGLHRKPIGLLNLCGYYDPLLALTAQAGREGFIYEAHRALFQVDENPQTLLAALEAYRPPAGLERWVTR